MPSRLPLPWRTASLLATAAVLAGCASMSPQECRTANWYEKGRSDGLHGESRAYFEEHVQACAEAHVTPDAQAYRQGWELGIQSFCTPQNGRDVGRAGRSYTSGTCPAALEPAFEREYRRGRDVYNARQQLDQIRNRQQSKQNDLDRAKDDGVRERLRRELRDLDRDAGYARDNLDRAERRMYD